MKQNKWGKKKNLNKNKTNKRFGLVSADGVQLYTRPYKWLTAGFTCFCTQSKHSFDKQFESIL